MRILLAYDGFYKASGGIETHLFDLATKLPHTFDILTDLFPPEFAYRSPELGDRVRVVGIGPVNSTVTPSPGFFSTRWSFPLRIWADYSRLRQKSKFVARGQWDVCHFQSHNIGSAIARLSRLFAMDRLLPWRLLRAAPRSRRLLTVHGLSSTMVSGAWAKNVESALLSHFERVVCVDRHLVSAVRSRAKERGHELRASYIPNSVDTRFFGYRPLPKGPSLRIGFVGRAEMSRGIDWVARLARRLPESLELHLVLAGNRSDLARVPDLLFERARSVKTNLHRQEIAEFYRNIHVVFNPVLAEGISRTTLEAMAVGRPPIMIRRGDRYPVVDGKTGFLVDTIEEAVERCEELARDRNELTRISREAREAVEREFDCDVVLPKWDRMYREIGGG